MSEIRAWWCPHYKDIVLNKEECCGTDIPLIVKGSEKAACVEILQKEALAHKRNSLELHRTMDLEASNAEAKTASMFSRLANEIEEADI